MFQHSLVLLEAVLACEVPMSGGEAWRLARHSISQEYSVRRARPETATHQIACWSEQTAALTTDISGMTSASSAK